jgi:lipoyl(octanoyl) transferase
VTLELKVIDVGQKKYDEVERIQESLAVLRAKEMIPDTLVVAQHPPTITTGLSASRNKVYASTEELAAKGIDFFSSRRAGGAAYLGPGQLVFYPVVHLPGIGVDIFPYLREIENVASHVANRMGAKTFVGTEHNPTTNKSYHGAWYIREDGTKCKFLAQGYHAGNNLKLISRGGFTINVGKESHEHFDLIDHCGFRLNEVGAVSFEEMLGYRPAMDRVKDEVIKELVKKFGYGYVSNSSFKEVEKYGKSQYG